MSLERDAVRARVEASLEALRSRFTHDVDWLVGHWRTWREPSALIEALDCDLLVLGSVDLLDAFSVPEIIALDGVERTARSILVWAAHTDDMPETYAVRLADGARELVGRCSVALTALKAGDSRDHVAQPVPTR